MPIYRGPDGKIIEERTRKAQNEDEATRVVSGKQTGTADKAADDTVNLGRKDDIPSTTDENKTKKHGAAENPAPASPADNDRTRLAGAPTNVEQNTTSASAHMAVGWLSIIAGPGLGTSLPLGYGANSLGRAENERICLNFGDQQISRQGHAIVTYEPRGKTFYLQNGGGHNLTYLDDAPVLTPTEMKNHSKITVGETTLYFTQLCGDAFDWQDYQ